MRIFVAALSFLAIFVNSAHAESSIAASVAEMNAEITRRHLPILTLEPGVVQAWLIDFIQVKVAKDEGREVPLRAIRAGEFPEGYGLRLDSELRTIWAEGRYPSSSGWSDRYFHLSMVQDHSLRTPVDAWRTNPYYSVCNDSFHLCEEPFRSELPGLGRKPIPREIPLKIKDIQVEGNPLAGSALRDALEVEIQLTHDNLESIVDYFAVGWSSDELRGRVQELLGSELSRWIKLQELFVSWVGAKVNTFPTRTDNDVCHNPAREFFYQQQSPKKHPAARSTEAVNVLLHDYYCLLSEEETPTFGDYLYVPSRHSARYMLQDLQSGRDIVFSVQSGGRVPYRFAWMDEDFSMSPFGHKPDPEVRKKVVDIWRRCRK